MSLSFVDFLSSSDPEVKAIAEQFVQAAISESENSLDRFSNAFQSVKEAREMVLIPGIKKLEQDYVNLYNDSRLNQPNPEKKVDLFALDEKSELRVNGFLDKLFHVACHQLLDENGQLHPKIVENLKLNQFKFHRPYQGNEEYYRNQLVNGFVLELTQRLGDTPAFAQAAKNLYETSPEIGQEGNAAQFIFPAIGNRLTQRKDKVVEKGIQLRMLYPLGSPQFEFVSQHKIMQQNENFFVGFKSLLSQYFKELNQAYATFLSNIPEDRRASLNVATKPAFDMINAQINNIGSQTPVNFQELERALTNLSINIDYASKNVANKSVVNKGAELFNRFVSADVFTNTDLSADVKKSLEKFTMVVPPMDSFKYHLARTVALMEKEILAADKVASFQKGYVDAIRPAIQALREESVKNPPDIRRVDYMLKSIHDNNQYAVKDPKHKAQAAPDGVFAKISNQIVVTKSKIANISAYGSRDPSVEALIESKSAFFPAMQSSVVIHTQSPVSQQSENSSSGPSLSPKRQGEDR